MSALEEDTDGLLTDPKVLAAAQGSNGSLASILEAGRQSLIERWEHPFEVWPDQLRLVCHKLDETDIEIAAQGGATLLAVATSRVETRDAEGVWVTQPGGIRGLADAMGLGDQDSTEVIWALFTRPDTGQRDAFGLGQLALSVQRWQAGLPSIEDALGG